MEDLDNGVPFYAILSVIVRELTKMAKKQFQRDKDDVARIESMKALIGIENKNNYVRFGET